ncbi:Endonuclease/exonuclease/phosphatase, partial [Mycena latifolia]
MSASQGGDPLPNRLRIWQQNLDHNLNNQHELLQTMGRDKYHFAALQEPYMGPGNVTRANPYWRTVYPTQHGMEGKRTRAVMLVNSSLPTDNWSQIHIPLPDVVVVELRGGFGTLRIINIYNDGDHDESL